MSTPPDPPPPPPPPVRTRKRSKAPAEAPPEDYKVGYGKPPREHQFGPDRPGNIKGRPKGSVSIKSELNRLMNETLVATINGRRKTITQREALLRRMFEQGLKGHLPSLALLLRLEAIHQAAPAAGASEAERDQSDTLTAAERRLLSEHLARLKDREAR